jgi:hypothetical protein
MLLPKFIPLAAACLAVSLPFHLAAQQLSTEEKTAAIQTIAKQIAANYVYPEKGGQIASFIQTANFHGDFNKANDWKEFDKMVTESLQKFSRDHHLYVRNDPDEVNRLKSSKKDTEQMHINGNNSVSNNYGFQESRVLENNIGYIKLSEINITKKSLSALYKAMHEVENTKALIIDLRDNGGGWSEIGAVLESFFLPENTPVLEFSGRSGDVHTDSTVGWLKEKKYDKPVYIIINKNTASAAEAFAFVLQQNNRAKIVGERSSGAAYMNDWYVVNDENYVSVSTSAPHLPGKDISWQDDGIQPDIKIKNGDPLQILLTKI